MELLLIGGPVAIPLVVLAVQLHTNRRRDRRSLHAQQMADAFFDMYKSWAENRRAQVEPINEELLRTSSAAFYAAVLRLTTLVNDNTLKSLNEFVLSGLLLGPQGDRTSEAFWKLHEQVVKDLGYRPQPDRRLVAEMIQSPDRDIPTLYLGDIEQPASVEQLRARRKLGHEAGTLKTPSGDAAT